MNKRKMVKKCSFIGFLVALLLLGLTGCSKELACSKSGKCSPDNKCTSLSGKCSRNNYASSSCTCGY
jgi:hypothetical protein